MKKQILKTGIPFILLIIGLLAIGTSCGGDDTPCTTQTWYEDADQDGFGNINVTMVACNVPAGYVADNTDCDDSSPTTYPGATELCDGVDNNCDGNTDEGCVEICDDGIDNDGDGLIDCADPDCSGDVTCQTGCAVDGDCPPGQVCVGGNCQ